MRQAGSDGILVFPTLPRHLNTNPDIALYAATALGRVAPEGTDVRLIELREAASAIGRTRPRLALGIGSVARGEIDFEALFRAAEASRTTLAYWLHDEPYEFDFAWRILDCCHRLFVNDRSAVDFYGRDHVGHLPLAASLDHHFAWAPRLADRPLDVFFCGAGYANRRRLVARLRRVLARSETLVLGTGWNEALAFCHNRRLDPVEIRRHYASARLTLNIGRHDHIANRRYDLVASTPGPRTFEAAAAGALQATVLEGLEIADHYELGSEILTFDDVAGFEALLDDVRRRPEHYDGVVAAAQARTRAEHTYDHRVAAILAGVGMAASPPS